MTVFVEVGKDDVEEVLAFHDPQLTGGEGHPGTDHEALV